MADIERVTVALTADLAQTVRSAVEAGEYASTSEIVREALRDWSDKRLLRLRDLERLKAEIQKGIDEIDAGLGVPAEQAFKELRARYRAKARKAMGMGRHTPKK
ncbi:MAG: ribbon-helix-helix protein, CopG family [Alphaproteobacteria bacterium]|nr:ribbon-helix-helix protein, CopG family [Alphaproteobacteria bacterium]